MADCGFNSRKAITRSRALVDGYCFAHTAGIEHADTQAFASAATGRHAQTTITTSREPVIFWPSGSVPTLRMFPGSVPLRESATFLTTQFHAKTQRHKEITKLRMKTLLVVIKIFDGTQVLL